MLFIKWEFLKNKSMMRGIFFISILFMFFTLIIFYGVLQTVSEYSRANILIDNYAVNNMYYYIGSVPFARTPSSVGVFTENFTFVFLLPSIIGAFFCGKYFQDRTTKSINIKLPFDGSWRYYQSYIIKITVIFILFFISASLLQGAFGFSLDYFLKPVPRPNLFSFIMLESIVLSSIRLSVFYGLTLTIALSLSVLFPFIGRLVHLIPLIIVISSELATKSTTPLREAFIHSGMRLQDKAVFYWWITGMLILAMILMMLIPLIRKNEL